MKAEIYNRKLLYLNHFIHRRRSAETSVPLTSITVMRMLSAITLRGLITAHAALDTLEMEHHASVYQYDQYL